MLTFEYKFLPGISDCSLCAKSFTFALTSSKTPYIDPVVSNDIATSRRPSGGSGTAAAGSVLVLALTLGVFDKVFVIDAAFFNDSFDFSDVSPTVAPDFSGTTVVTVPPSITTLDNFFVRDGLAADESFFDETLFVKLAASALSSTVRVEAFLSADGVGDPISPLLLVDRAAIL